MVNLRILDEDRVSPLVLGPGEADYERSVPAALVQALA